VSAHSLKARREHIEAVVEEFEKRGVRQWRSRRTACDHTLIEFEYGGRWHTLTISGSAKSGAIHSTRRDLRRAFQNSQAAISGQAADCNQPAR